MDEDNDGSRKPRPTIDVMASMLDRIRQEGRPDDPVAQMTQALDAAKQAVEQDAEEVRRLKQRLVARYDEKVDALGDKEKELDARTAALLEREQKAELALAREAALVEEVERLSRIAGPDAPIGRSISDPFVDLAAMRKNYEEKLALESKRADEATSELTEAEGRIKALEKQVAAYSQLTGRRDTPTGIGAASRGGDGDRGYAEEASGLYQALTAELFDDSEISTTKKRQALHKALIGQGMPKDAAMNIIKRLVAASIVYDHVCEAAEALDQRVEEHDTDKARLRKSIASFREQYEQQEGVNSGNYVSVFLSAIEEQLKG